MYTFFLFICLESAITLPLSSLPPVDIVKFTESISYENKTVPLNETLPKKDDFEDATGEVKKRERRDDRDRDNQVTDEKGIGTSKEDEKRRRQDISKEEINYQGSDRQFKEEDNHRNRTMRDKENLWSGKAWYEDNDDHLHQHDAEPSGRHRQAKEEYRKVFVEVVNLEKENRKNEEHRHGTVPPRKSSRRELRTTSNEDQNNRSDKKWENHGSDQTQQHEQSSYENDIYPKFKKKWKLATEIFEKEETIKPDTEENDMQPRVQFVQRHTYSYRKKSLRENEKIKNNMRVKTLINKHADQLRHKPVRAEKKTSREVISPRNDERGYDELEQNANQAQRRGHEYSKKASREDGNFKNMKKRNNEDYNHNAELLDRPTGYQPGKKTSRENEDDLEKEETRQPNTKENDKQPRVQFVQRHTYSYRKKSSRENKEIKNNIRDNTLNNKHADQLRHKSVGAEKKTSREVISPRNDEKGYDELEQNANQAQRRGHEYSKKASREDGNFKNMKKRNNEDYNYEIDLLLPHESALGKESKMSKEDTNFRKDKKVAEELEHNAELLDRPSGYQPGKKTSRESEGDLEKEETRKPDTKKNDIHPRVQFVQRHTYSYGKKTSRENEKIKNNITVNTLNNKHADQLHHKPVGAEKKTSREVISPRNDEKGYDELEQNVNQAQRRGHEYSKKASREDGNFKNMKKRNNEDFNHEIDLLLPHESALGKESKMSKKDTNFREDKKVAEELKHNAELLDRPTGYQPGKKTSRESEGDHADQLHHKPVGAEKKTSREVISPRNDEKGYDELEQNANQAQRRGHEYSKKASREDGNFKNMKKRNNEDYNHEIDPLLPHESALGKESKMSKEDTNFRKDKKVAEELEHNAELLDRPTGYQPGKKTSREGKDDHATETDDKNIKTISDGLKHGNGKEWNEESPDHAVDQNRITSREAAHQDKRWHQETQNHEEANKKSQEIKTTSFVDPLYQNKDAWNDDEAHAKHDEVNKKSQEIKTTSFVDPLYQNKDAWNDDDPRAKHSTERSGQKSTRNDSERDKEIQNIKDKEIKWQKFFENNSFDKNEPLDEENRKVESKDRKWVQPLDDDVDSGDTPTENDHERRRRYDSRDNYDPRRYGFQSLLNSANGYNRQPLYEYSILAQDDFSRAEPNSRLADYNRQLADDYNRPPPANGYRTPDDNHILNNYYKQDYGRSEPYRRQNDGDRTLNEFDIERNEYNRLSDYREEPVLDEDNSRVDYKSSGNDNNRPLNEYERSPNEARSPDTRPDPRSEDTRYSNENNYQGWPKYDNKNKIDHDHDNSPEEFSMEGKLVPDLDNNEITTKKTNKFRPFHNNFLAKIRKRISAKIKKILGEVLL